MSIEGQNTMINANSRTTFAAMLLAGVAGLVTVATPQESRADDCLLDTNNDGDADTDTDTDLGADSSGDDTRLACGLGASASMPSSTALGVDASASGIT
jgi:hypothetical protein